MRLWTALAALALLGGCSSPKTQFFTLVPAPPTHAADPAVAGPPLIVGHVSLPGALDRTSLVTRGPGTAVSVSDNERWAAPLDELVRRTLTDDLRNRLGPGGDVLAPGDPSPLGGVRRVVLTVQRFSADSDGRVVLEADWTLATGNPPKAGPIHHVHAAEDAGSTSGGAIAAAMSRALGVVADSVSRGTAYRDAQVRDGAAEPWPQRRLRCASNNPAAVRGTWRQHDVAVFATFTLRDPDHHALAVDASGVRRMTSEMRRPVA
jgi:hypothetical protein